MSLMIGFCTSLSPFHLGRLASGSKSFLRLFPLPLLNIALLSVDNRKSKRKPLKFNIYYKTGHKWNTAHRELSRRGRVFLDSIGAARSSIKQRMEAIIEKENIWTIPNILCCTRIIISPYLGYLVFQEDYNTAFIFLVLAGLTDLFDGLIARTFSSQASKLGTFLDPMADKVLIATLCITLTYMNLMPVSLTGLILSRDIVLAAAGFYIRYKSLPPPKTLVRYFDATHATAKLEPTGISKFNTTVQLAAVGIGVMSPVFDFVEHPYLQLLWYFTATTTIASALSYVYKKDTYKILKNSNIKKHRKI